MADIDYEVAFNIARIEHDKEREQLKTEIARLRAANKRLEHLRYGLSETINKLRAALEQAKFKLMLYREAHGGEYLGGVEYSELMRRIEAVLA